MIITGAALCMAITIYHEARGEMVPGQYAVAQVLLNRAEKDPDKVCQAAFKRRQFSWTIRGVKRVKEGWVLRKALAPKDEYAWWMAQVIAARVLVGAPDFTKGEATHYHANYITKPSWAGAMVQTATIGTHVFYRQ